MATKPRISPAGSRILVAQFGSVLVLRKQNKDAEARAVESDLKESWEHADSTIGDIHHE